MANPQTEHGYTKIANELLQALIKYVTNPSWLRTSLFIIRLTYGWGRKEVTSNLKSFASMLHLSEEYIKSILTEMELSKMITIQWKDARKFVVSFNKDYEQWPFVKK